MDLGLVALVLLLVLTLIDFLKISLCDGPVARLQVVGEPLHRPAGLPFNNICAIRNK
jgi:hypothetical protein